MSLPFFARSHLIAGGLFFSGNGCAALRGLSARKGTQGGAADGREKGGVCIVMRRVRMVMVPLVLVLVACFGMRPALADWNDGGAWNVDDADMGIKWGPTSVGGDRKGFVMVSDNRFNACLMLCGISTNDERLTADAKAKLSNSSTGGGFYLLAQRFGQYGNEGNLPDWAKPSLDLGSITANAAIRTCAAMYGADATWWGDYTELERTNALTDLVAVLNDDGSGGGGSGEHVSSGMTFEIGPENLLYAKLDNWNETFLAQAKVYRLTIKLTAYAANNINSYIGSYPNLYVLVEDTGSTPVKAGYIYIILTKNPVTPSVGSSSVSINFGDCQVCTTGSRVYASSGSTYTFDWGSYTHYANYNYSRSLLWLNTSRAETPIPPTQWPDSPTYEQPTAPVVPDPVEPTIPSEPSAPTPVEPVQPDPSAPDQNPVFITQPTYVENTYTADLQGILDALNEHCLHLQNALYANVSDLYNKLSTKLTNDLTNLKSFLHGEFGWLNDARHNDDVATRHYLEDLFSWLGGLISDNFYSLSQHLTQLFNWLAEQFDFSFTGTGYNDDTVVSWLKKIYSKLGTGMNTRPNDPVAEPDSFGDWLNRLLQNFVLDLLAVGQDALADLVENFRQLITKFPFSLPWDIAALLGLLVAEPVAPAFDFPLYTIADGGIQQAATCHISLEDYNSAWEGVRFIEKVGFAVFLAWNATHFKRYFDGAGKEHK